MASTHQAPGPMTPDEARVIVASSLGTVFEWYDFYLYGALASILARQYFSALDSGSAFLFALLAFAAGFIVRPFGALLFGCCRPTTALAWPHRWCSSGCVCCRALRWGVNTAVPLCMWPNTPRRAAAACIPPGYKPPRRWAC